MDKATSVPIPNASAKHVPMRLAVATWRVATGARLAVRATSAQSNVDVRKGEKTDEVRLDVDASAAYRATREGEAVMATILDGSATFHVPPRFCGVDVSTCGGDVHVEAVVEADLSVDSRGGSVRVGQARGMRAYVRSGGGDVVLGDLAAHVDVETGRGRVQARKVLGPTVHIATVGGRVDVGAIYGETVRVTSVEGDVKVSQLSAEDGVVETRQGMVDIKGVQGCLHVRTQGQPIHMYLHEQARRVLAQSNGGSITCKVPKGIQAKVYMQGNNNKNVSPVLKFTRLTEENGVLSGVLGQADGPNETATTIRLYAGTGTINLEESSWMEQVLCPQTEPATSPSTH